MILSARNVVLYLMERGLLTASSVVDGDVQVIETTRRNRNFKIVRRESASLFVKQIQLWDQPTITSLRREAICYWMAAKESGFTALKEVLPQYILYDPVLNILVTELVPSAENLSEHHYK